MPGIGVSTKNSTVVSLSSVSLDRLDRTLDAYQLGEIYLCRPASTIFKDITRAPHRLPPSIQIPGRRGRLWLESEVVRWLKEHQEPQLSGTNAEQIQKLDRQPATANNCSNARRVGRPTKRQQLERAQQLASRGQQ